MTSNERSDNKGVAIILAAGRSRRFGNTDKRLCRLPDGNTMLATVYQQACDVFDQVVVVLSKNETPSLLGLPKNCVFICALNSGQGMGNSLACAFSELCQNPSYQEAQYAAVLLGDMPCIQKTTFKILKKHSNKDRIIRPFYQHQAGHPVLFGKTFWQALRVLEGEIGAKKVIDSHLESLDEVNILDNGVIYDIDTQEALTLLIR